MARNYSIIPGFGLSLGYSIFYLSLIVLLPLAGLFFTAASLSWPEIMHIITSPRAIAAYKLTLSSAFIAAVINVFFGLALCWALVRYEFFGKKVIDAMIDLPFALPTAIAGITLTTIYAPDGLLGAPLAKLGIKIAFTEYGIIIALIFVGIPFVVRTIEPIMRDLDASIEEAAYLLGANNWQIFAKIIMPSLLPSLLTGFSLAFARGIGEYGSVIFIAGNIPGKTEILPLLINIRLEQFDYAGASILAIVMLSLAFILLLMINLVQKRVTRFK